MKKFLFFVLLTLTTGQLYAEDVECEKKENRLYYWGDVSTVKTCFMDKVATIDSPGVEISSRDETIKGLMMAFNKKIRLLPEKVAQKFPNLQIYYASSCSLTEVSKSNFKNLVKLKGLSLSVNQIEKISNNTFGDLKLLKEIYLRK